MEKETKNLLEKLSNIQNELKAPKGQFNSFGKYKYRSCEDILEALKPILKENRTSLVISDELENIGERYYVRATATIYDLDSDVTISNTAYAREEEEKKGMDGSQITGTASSYARKYALNGLFNIDDTKDADTDEFTNQNKSGTNQNETQQEKIKSLVTEKQKQIIKSLYSTDEIRTYFKSLGKAKLSELTVKEASDFIQKKMGGNN